MSVNRPTKRVDAAEEPDSSAAETVADRPVAELEAEVTDLKDKLLRALAEQENMRRRAQREVEEAAKYTASGLARICSRRQMIDVAGFDRADIDLMGGLDAVRQKLGGKRRTRVRRR